MSFRSIDKLEHESEFVHERSYGDTLLGHGHATMELFQSIGQPGYYCIEWVVTLDNLPDEEEVENIGIWVDSDGNVIDYDGIMGFLPKEAIDLLDRNGITVGPDFREEE